MTTMQGRIIPLAPGESISPLDLTAGGVLRDHFLRPHKISLRRLANATGVSTAMFSKIIAGKAGVSPPVAVRLSRALGTSVEFWLDLQQPADIKNAESKLIEVPNARLLDGRAIEAAVNAALNESALVETTLVLDEMRRLFSDKGGPLEPVDLPDDQG